MAVTPVILRVALAAIVLGLAITLAHSGAAVQPQQPGQEGSAPRRGNAPFPRPVVETRDLMDLFNRQLYQNLSAALSAKPTAPDQWTLVEENALRIAEVANLVAIRAYAPDQSREWTKHAFRLQQAAIVLAKTAGKHNFDETRRDYTNVIQACNACHQTFAPETAPQLKP